MVCVGLGVLCGSEGPVCPGTQPVGWCLLRVWQYCMCVQVRVCCGTCAVRSCVFGSQAGG